MAITLKPERPLSRGAAVLLLLAMLLIACIGDHLYQVDSRSIPYHLVLRAYGAPQPGDYLTVAVSTPLIRDGRLTYLTKQLVCAPGQTLRYEAPAHYCDGRKIDEAREQHFADGRTIPVFVWSGTIPPGKDYVLGTSRYSLDSRYFGFVDAGRAVKVWGLY